MSSSLLSVVDSGLRTHLFCLPHCPWTITLDLSPLLSVVDCSSASPFAICLLWVPFSNSLTGVPLPTSVSSKILSSGLWFRAKTDKGIVCLVDQPYSATNSPYYPCHLFTINYKTYKKINILYRHDWYHARCHTIQTEPSLLLPQKHRQYRLLHKIKTKLQCAGIVSSLTPRNDSKGEFLTTFNQLVEKDCYLAFLISLYGSNAL